MTLTDEEAREIVSMLHYAAIYADDHVVGDRDVCLRLITLLESRIGVVDELTTAYMAGFEKGKDAGRKERG